MHSHPSPQENVQEVQVPLALYLPALSHPEGCFPFPDDLVWAGSTGCHCLGPTPSAQKGKRGPAMGGVPRGQEELDQNLGLLWVGGAGKAHLCGHGPLRAGPQEAAAMRVRK